MSLTVIILQLRFFLLEHPLAVISFGLLGGELNFKLSPLFLLEISLELQLLFGFGHILFGCPFIKTMPLLFLSVIGNS